MNCETLIVSDIHLGSEISNAKGLLQLLENSTFRRLILLGDIFSDLNFSRLTAEHWNLVSHIRKLSNPKRNIEVVWVEGNHDAGLIEVMRHLLGIEVYRTYTWSWHGKLCVATHGDEFDELFAGGNPWFNGLVTSIYLGLQKFSITKHWLPKILDRFHTNFQRLEEKVVSGAIRKAAGLGAEYIFCGHTHQAHRKIVDNISYFNSGCWLNDSGTYIALAETVDLYSYKVPENESRL